MTRVLHTGDTHIGYRQYHQPERREDFLAAFRRVVEDAVELDVDAVVHAGDMFHDRRPGLVDLLGTIEVLETLADADVPFLAIVGNHETKRDAQWLDLFETMGLATRLDAAPVVVDDTAFYGLDFVPRSRRSELDYEFEPHDADSAALVSHGLFAPLVPDYGNVEWDAAEVLAAATVDFDAMLLGDEHAPTREEVEDTWVTYCGSTERASAGERDERGYNLVEFDADDGVHITRRGIETRAFVFVDLELAAGEGFERVRRRLEEHDLEEAVVHVSITGAGEAVSAARVESFATEEGALVARVKDHREVSDGTDVEVTFADPDSAVRERVRSLGLSDAERELDETIRASKVADSNVADEIERRVEESLADPERFVPAEETDTETAADRLDGDDDSSTGPDDAAPTADADGGAGSADATDAETEPDSPSEASAESSPAADADPSSSSNSEPSAADGESPEEQTETGPEPSEAADGESPEEQTETGPEPSEAADGESQASMEDYL
jgi:DNA repair exonuclease SbcCD nuclease subunit